ncbi:MAG TPA: TonB family protein [Terriglobales bacterium]|nr:TonB family protein [Terriglobales bacterium]
MKVAIPYGAFELKRAYQGNLGRAVLVAGIFNFLLASFFVFFSPAESQKPGPEVGPPIIKNMTPQPPPSIIKDLTPHSVQQIEPKVGLPSSGVPMAIPDNQNRGTENFATREDMRRNLQSPDLEGEGVYGGGSPGIETLDEQIPPSDTFIPYDSAPVMVKEVKPAYPELARRSGVEGRVYVQAWIDKHGKVKEAKCLTQGSINPDIFCESAIQAARQNEYKPAISNKVPVACWVTYKVEFVLK